MQAKTENTKTMILRRMENGSFWLKFHLNSKRTFSGRKATVRHINKCYATQEYIHHDVFSQSCLFLNMHHILLCVMHGVVALTSPVTIIKYAGGMVSWNIYYNNLHRRSSAKTSRIAPKLRTTQREKKAWTEQIPAIKKLWWVCNELNCAFLTYLI